MSRTISFLRFPLICIVVFIHTDLADIYMRGVRIVGPGEYLGYEAFAETLKLLFLLAVPMFFAISGFLFFDWSAPFNKSAYLNKLKKRATSLLLPYMLWNVIVWAVNTLGPMLLPSLAAGRGTALSDMTIDRVLAMFWDYGGGKPICIQLWFLRDLMVVCLLSPIVYTGIEWLRHWFVLIVGVLFVSNIVPDITGLSIKAFFCFSLGAWYRMCFFKGRLLEGKAVTFSGKTTAAMAVVYVAVIAALALGVSYTLAPILKSTSIVVGMPLVLFAASRMSGFQWPKAVAQSTFFVYGCHIIVLSPVERHMVSAMPLSDTTLSVAFIVIPLITIAICVAASVTLQRLCHPAWAILTGGR